MNKFTDSSSTFVDFKEVKERVTILQILERYDLLPSLRRSADRLSGPCPIHGGTNPTQFRVSISKNCWNCFGNCGRGGNIIDFVQMKEGVPFRDAAILIQEWFMSDKTTSRLAEAPASCLAPEPTEPEENPPLNFELKSLRPDHPYLAERGLSKEIVEDYGIGYCSRGCLRQHIVFPIRNIEGKLVGYIGRWPGDPPEGQGKYKFPKGFHKSLEVFNCDRAVKTPLSNPLLVVEGVLGCLRLVEMGFPATVALFGSSLSGRQETIILQLAVGRTINLLFDSDEAGKKGAAEAASRLSLNAHIRIVDIGSFCSQPERLEYSHLQLLLGKTKRAHPHVVP